MIDLQCPLAEETPDQRAERRRRLLRLDRCLDVLEDAMEQDRAVVGAPEATVLMEATLPVGEGTPLEDAIEVVLLYQEAYMRPVGRPAAGQRRRGPGGAGGAAFLSSLTTDDLQSDHGRSRRSG